MHNQDTTPDPLTMTPLEILMHVLRDSIQKRSTSSLIHFFDECSDELETWYDRNRVSRFTICHDLSRGIMHTDFYRTTKEGERVIFAEVCGNRLHIYGADLDNFPIPEKRSFNLTLAQKYCEFLSEEVVQIVADSLAEKKRQLEHVKSALLEEGFSVDNIKDIIVMGEKVSDEDLVDIARCALEEAGDIGTNGSTIQ